MTRVAHRGRYASVRFRITLVAAVAVAGVLTVAGFALLAVQRSQLEDAQDASLSRRADDLASSELELDDNPHVLTNLAGDDSVVQIVGPDGDVVAATSNAIDIAPIGEPVAEGQVVRTVDALPIEDDEYRVLSRAFETPDGRGTLHVAANTDDMRGVINELRATLVVVVPLATLGLSALVWALVGRTLRPVEAIRSEVAALGAADLERRVPRPGTGDEIDRLAATMNDMLERLDRSARRQSQFVADASHELRSPLARIRTELDVSRADPADRAATMASILEEIEQLGALVDDLLHLARSDSGHATLDRRMVDLDDLVLEEVARVRRQHDVTVDLHRVSGAGVVGDHSQLRRMVRNLLDNAVRHASERIEVSLREEAGTVEFAVVDDGPGIDPEHAATIFDRFVRLDDARTRDRGGTGLGLAITRDIVERHGGTIDLDRDADRRGGARFVVVLPAAEH